MKQYKIVIADDHPIYRSGLREGLASYDHLIVSGEAPTGKIALELVRETDPDCLLLDMEMPELSGLEVTKILFSEGSRTKILPLSSHSDPEYVFGVLEHGAEGYLMKDEPLDHVVEAIDSVMDGGVYISPRVSVEIIAAKKHNYDQKTSEIATYNLIAEMGITPTLLRILILASNGRTNKQIGEELFRSPHTIRNHMTKIKDLVGVSYRPALVAWAWKHDIPSLNLSHYKTIFKHPFT